MPGVKIVTDSSCDLPQELVDELGIKIVPLTVRFGDDEFVDRVELTTEDFWSRAGDSDTLPETAAPSPGAFQQAYEQAAADGYDEVVAIMLSSVLSATIQAADAGAKAVVNTITVRVVDSLTVSMGLGILVLEAAREAGNGASADQIVDAVEDRVGRTRVHAALDTLESLKKGGRIGAAASLLGSLLSIKPMIEVREGAVEPTKKPRTRAKALTALVNIVTEAGTLDNLAVMQANCSDVDAFVAKLREVYDGEIVVGDIGPVIGAHAGPGAIGVTFQLAN